MRRRRIDGTVVASALIALALLSPLVLVVLDAHTAGWHEISAVLFRARTAMLLWHTVLLSAIVVTLAASIGVAAALGTERGGVPARRLWTVLIVMPIAIPDFVVGYAWHTHVPQINPLLGSTIVMTLGTYPLVYLPVAAALRRCDPAMQETAYSLGTGRISTFWRVTLPLIRTAVLGGCVLVALTVMSEYGAFEILRFQTFTTEIFTEFQFNSQAAAALSFPLVLLGLLVLLGDACIPRRGVAHARPHRPAARRPLGWAMAPVLLGFALLVVLAVGIPIETLIYWLAKSENTTLPAAATLGQATWATLRYSACGALLAVLLALPVAMMSLRGAGGGPGGSRSGRVARSLLERSTFVTQAIPGIVIALSLVFFATRYWFGIYQTSTLLIVAYAILHFPLALVCVKTSVAQAPPGLRDVGHSLGAGRARVFFRVTLPLIAPGLLAGFCLVFLTAITELTATLVLAPIGVQTLATQFWAFQSQVAYGAAAPYALMLIGIAVIPGAILSLWFDRERYTVHTGAAVA